MKYLSIKKKDYVTEIHGYKKTPSGINFEISITTLYVGCIFCALVVISPPWTILIFSPLILIAFVIVVLQIVFFGGWAAIKYVINFFSKEKDSGSKTNKKPKHIRLAFFFLIGILAGLFMREAALWGYFNMIGRAQMDYLIYKDMKNNGETKQTMFLGDIKWSSWYLPNFDESVSTIRKLDIFFKKENNLYKLNQRLYSDIFTYKEFTDSPYHEYLATYKKIQKKEITKFITSLNVGEIKINDLTIKINGNEIESKEEMIIYKDMDFKKIKGKVTILIDLSTPWSRNSVFHENKLESLNKFFPTLRKGDEILVNVKKEEKCTFEEGYKIIEQWEINGIRTIVYFMKKCN